MALLQKHPQHSGDEGPCEYFHPIVGDVEFDYFCREIYVGVGGDVQLRARDGVSIVRKNAVAGTYLIGRWDMVISAGTTATDLIAGR